MFCLHRGGDRYIIILYKPLMIGLSDLVKPGSYCLLKSYRKTGPDPVL